MSFCDRGRVALELLLPSSFGAGGTFDDDESIVEASVVALEGIWGAVVGCMVSSMLLLWLTVCISDESVVGDRVDVRERLAVMAS